MCRHLAWLGPPVPISRLVHEPPHGLYEQAWAPRMQRHGTVNVDGFGVGWYNSAAPDRPLRHRRAVPIWTDPDFADVARVTHTHALVAAVRSATDGCAAGEEAAAPFRADGVLFSHNGVIPGWPGSVEHLAATELTTRELLGIEARTDSALLWALLLARARRGLRLDDAVAHVVAAVAAAAPTGRYNVLATDGTTVVATACGDTLFTIERDGGTVVASEPDDLDGPAATGGWRSVPDRTLLTIDQHGVTTRPLAVPQLADAATARPRKDRTA